MTFYADDYDDPYDATIYYCSECKQECDVKYEDEGIGSYEYWGALGVDVKWVGYSDCCEADLTTELKDDDDT